MIGPSGERSCHHLSTGGDWSLATQTAETMITSVPTSTEHLRENSEQPLLSWPVPSPRQLDSYSSACCPCHHPTQVYWNSPISDCVCFVACAPEGAQPQRSAHATASRLQLWASSAPAGAGNTHAAGRAAVGVGSVPWVPTTVPPRLPHPAPTAALCTSKLPGAAVLTAAASVWAAHAAAAVSGVPTSAVPTTAAPVTSW